MMKRFLSMFAILAISLLAACAQVPPAGCKGCPTGMSEECCGACPCGEEATSGKMCDHSKMKAKHHGKRYHKKPVAAAATTSSAKPAAAKTGNATPTIPNQEKGSMFDGVKKIIQDVQSKDVQPKDVKKPQ